MRNLITLCLLVYMALPVLSKNDGYKTYNFPKEKGIPMYGATIKDDLGPLHYVKFFSKEGKTTKIARIDEYDNGTHMRNLRCGAFCGNKYYGYLVNIYTYVEQPVAFGEVDFSTGKFKNIYEFRGSEELNAWPTLYEMTYDYASKTCWALGRSKDGEAVSDLYSINLDDGSYTKETSLDFYAWAMACDYDGTLYLIKGIPDKNNEFYAGVSVVKMNTADNNKIISEKRIKVEGKDFVPNYTHTMEFDHNSGDLYWIGSDNSTYQKIYILNPETGEAVRTGDMMYNVVSGLYIPFRGADSRDAAGKVTNLRAVPAADGSLNAKIEWNNPEKSWKGSSITSLESITVARDSESNVIATLNAGNATGKGMSYNDEKAHRGYNIYYITPQRIKGENGLTDSVRVFVGPDMPGRPENITLKAQDGNVIITWEAPSSGAHGEKYNAEGTMYEIVRMPDSIIIAKDVTGTTYTDDKIGCMMKYSYVIKSYNSEGEGLAQTSEKILIGSAHGIPFTDKFNNESCRDIWTVCDNNHDGATFEWGGGKYDDFNRFQAFLSNQLDMDDYLITPPLATAKGSTYRVTYNIMLGSTDDIHKFEIATGNAAAAGNMKETAASYGNITAKSYNQTTEYETKFKAAEDVTYVGFHCLSKASATGSYFAVKDVMIEQVSDNDLCVTSVNGPKELTSGKDIKLNVLVRNMGLKPQNKYSVEILSKDSDGKITSVGSTKDFSLEIKPDSAVEVPVTIHLSSEGEIELAGKVVLTGDTNEKNNIGPWQKFKVNASGTADFNIECNGSDNGETTTEPMNFYYEYSTVEQLYLKDEIKAECDGKITRIAFQYKDNDLKEETGTADVKIYLANTDKTGYSENPDVSEWSSPETSKLVFSGKVKIIKGNENLMVFDLEEPFEYDHTKNLAVQIWKEGSLTEMFPALFKTYGTEVETYRCLRYNSNRYAFGFSDSEKFFPIQAVPVLFIAMQYDEHSGIILPDGNSSIAYDSASGILKTGGHADKICITDLTGKIVFNRNVNDMPAIKLNLNKGIYVVKAVTNDGRNNIIKIVVR